MPTEATNNEQMTALSVIERLIEEDEDFRKQLVAILAPEATDPTRVKAHTARQAAQKTKAAPEQTTGHTPLRQTRPQTTEVAESQDASNEHKELTVTRNAEEAQSHSSTPESTEEDIEWCVTRAAAVALGTGNMPVAAVIGVGYGIYKLCKIFKK